MWYFLGHDQQSRALTHPVDRSIHRKALAVAFCLFLMWRAAVSFAWLGREILSYDALSLVDAVSLSQEGRLRRTLQDDYEIYAALRQAVPADGLVLFVTGSTLATVQRAMRIAVVLYPPRFGLVAGFPAVMRGGTPEEVVAVDLIREKIPAQDAWEPLESRETFDLWRYRTPSERSPR